MALRIWHYRLNQQDIGALQGCLPKLDALHDTMAGSGLGGRLALMQACVEVYRVIESLLQSEARAILRQRPGQQPEPGAPAPEES